MRSGCPRTASVSGVTETCQDCHLAGHTFRGAHDAELVRSALTVAVTVADGRATAHVTAARVGHRVPTGDPFRRMLFRACADAACAQPLKTWVFGRSFEETPRTWVLTGDTTLASGETRDLLLPAGTVAWELEYRYAEPQLEAELPDELVRLKVASGEITSAAP